jgi:hypothetical protein
LDFVVGCQVVRDVEEDAALLVDLGELVAGE